MKKIIPLSLLITLSLTSCKQGDVVNANNAKAEAEGKATDSLKSAFIAEIKKEPKVKDVVLTDAKVLYVAVQDDGTKRDGYAEYLCGIVAEQKADVEAVKVVEFGTMNTDKADNAYGKLLGETYCKK